MVRFIVFSLVLALFGGATLPAAAAEVPGIAGLNISGVARAQTNTTPVAITDMTWFRSAQGEPGNNYIQCADFRVLSRKPVQSVQFRLRFLDEFNAPHFTWTLQRRGSFTPGQVVFGRFDSSATYTNQGNQSCWVIPVGRDVDTGLARITKAAIETTDVVFDDGSVWHEGQSFDQAFAVDGSRFPLLRVAMRWTNEGRSPIHVLGASTKYDFSGNPQQCVSFRNVARVPASRIDFEWDYVDATNSRVVTLNANDNGTYTAPVRIDDQCWSVKLNSDQIRRIAFNDLHVKRVVFNDGSVWNEGNDFVRTWGNNGDPMAPSTVGGFAGNVPPGPAPAPGTTPPPPVQVFGGNGPGGSLRFGAIALDPSATIATLAADRESGALAAADAIAQCNAKAGAGRCTAPLQFGGSPSTGGSPCGAIAVYRGSPPVALTGLGNTEREAQAAALTKAGSSTANATILASGCNSQ